MPNNATPTQFQVFANFSMKHWMPPFQHSLVRLAALGTPTTGTVAWTRFLADWRLWVNSNVASVRQMQEGHTTPGQLGPASDAVGRATERLKHSAPPAGATRCLRVISG